MVRRFFPVPTVFLCLLCCVTTAGCVQAEALKKKYGADVSYFKGLKELEKGDVRAAEKLLSEASRKSTTLAARYALEELCAIGSERDRVKNALQLCKAYDDDAALAIACRELSAAGRHEKVLELTEGRDVATCDNQVAFYRCLALHETKAASFRADALRWYVERPFSALHAEAVPALFAEVPVAVQLRLSVYGRDYGAAVRVVREACADPSAVTPQLLSDAGKAFLYGSKATRQNVAFLDALAGDDEPEKRFYVHFYQGRLYDADQDLAGRSFACFVRAMDCAVTDAQYDNALWYYLDAALKDSISHALSELREYCPRWHDPAYFDDFLETLSLRLITKHLWEDYYETALLINGWASNEAVAQFSYVAARIVEEQFYAPPSRSALEACMQLYMRALSGGTSLYYTFLAAKKLGLGADETTEHLSFLHKEQNFQWDTDAEYILGGYVEFELADRIFPYWQEHSATLSMECVKRIASYLQACAAHDEGYCTKSLRIASRKLNDSEVAIDRELMELSFPQDFLKSVHQHCKAYGVDESFLFALIRSESYFDPAAVSHAGARGLTQFMRGTADEVAGRLKVKDYDLTDADTAIQFGAYYISSLTERFDGTPLLAAFAYNAGASRVFSWQRTVNLVFEKPSVPNDLFLESVPITETRGYGRKIVSAAAMYGMLYYGMAPGDVIAGIMEGE